MNSRRKFGQLFGSALLFPITGCTLNRGASKVEIDEISVGNADLTSHRIHLLLLEGGEPVYWHSTEVEAFSKAENRLGGGEVNGYPTDSGRYTLYVWKDDQPRSKWSEYDLSKHESSCVKVLILVGNRREGNIEIRVSTDCPSESTD